MYVHVYVDMYVCIFSTSAFWNHFLYTHGHYHFFFLRFLSLVPDAKPIKERVSAFKDAL